MSKRNGEPLHSLQHPVTIYNIFVEACDRGNLDLVRQMIADGINVNRPDKNGDLALSSAVKNSHAHIVDELLKAKGININEPNSISGRTALHSAAIHDNIDILYKLIEAGADVNARSTSGDIPLYGAGKLQANALIEAGADVNSTNNNGETAIHLVHSDQTTIDALIAGGADVNAVDRYGNTALHHYQDWNKLYEIKSLLEAGADFNIVNNNGKKAIDSAPESEGGRGGRAYIKAAEYSDELQAYLRRDNIEFESSNNYEVRFGELIGKRIANLWNSKDLNHPYPIEAQKAVGERLVALGLDKKLEEKILTDYTEKLNNFAIQKTQDNKVATNILKELLPFITHKYCEVKDKAPVPLPESSAILNLDKTPNYLKMAATLLEEHSENPQALLHAIIKGKATIYGSKLPSFEECLAEGNMHVENIGVMASQVQHLTHKIMTPEMKEVVENVTNNICAIELSQDQAKAAVMLFNPYLSEANSQALREAAASVSSELDTFPEAKKYLEVARDVAAKYQDNPSLLFEKLVKGKGLPKILTRELPEGMPELIISELHHAQAMISGGIGDNPHEAAKASKDSEQASGGGGGGAGDEGSHYTESRPLGGDFDDSVGSKRVRSTSPTPVERAAAAAKARRITLEHASHPLSTELPLSPAAGGAKGRDSSPRR